MSCEALNCSKLPVAFVHVSGSGGTSVCNAAAAMGVRTPSVRWGCQFPGTNVLGHGPSDIFGSCHAFALSVRSHSVDFFENEGYLRDGKWADAMDGLCALHFRHAILLKDPVERIVSQALDIAPRVYRSHAETLLTTWLNGSCVPTVACLRSNGTQDRTGKEAEGRAERGFVMHKSLGHAFMGTPAIENYATRMLLGEEAFHRHLTLEDGRAALHKLTRFQLVYPIELFTESVGKLARLLGKPPPRPDLPSMHSRNHSALVALHGHQLSERVLLALRERNQMDEALREYAWKRARAEPP